MMTAGEMRAASAIHRHGNIATSERACGAATMDQGRGTTDERLAEICGELLALDLRVDFQRLMECAPPSGLPLDQIRAWDARTEVVMCAVQLQGAARRLVQVDAAVAATARGER